jgi:flavin-dependent dehydrogenase
MNMAQAKVLVIGGGPAGSVAALTLQQLGHDVELYERELFPRYRVGESLLPGTMSILKRLGLQEKIDAANFVKKPSATFLWGQDQAPWTFSFATPRVSDWIFNHAMQVKREEFDALLLDEVKNRGVRVFQGTPVRDVDVSSPDHVEITVEGDGETATVRGDFLVDASGSSSILVKKLQLRRYDDFYRSLAVWSYFQRPDPFTGDLRGTTYSITFEDGWVWMIPLKGNLYSVGIVVDQSKAAELQEKGAEQFYIDTLAKCARAMKILDGAERVDQVRLVRDWSYDTKTFSSGRFFLSGDSACFTDPLFSQGVHLATQSAVSAGAAIDRLHAHPEEADAIHRWYAKSYSDTYEQYHEFLASFYTFASFTEPTSEFWRRRRIEESADNRLERREWFHKLVDKVNGSDDWNVADFRDRASTMIAIGKHQRQELSSEFSDSELQVARIRWLSKLTSQLNSISKLRWNGDEVVLHPYFKVNPRTFQLEPKLVLGNETGRTMTKYPVEPPYAEVFHAVLRGELDYKGLIRSLGALGAKETSSQIVIRLFEAGLLTAFDKQGQTVHIQDRLRFDGVGVEYEV